jgi:hypothetical protein
MPEQHTILGGRVYVYKRPNSSLWQPSSYFAGKIVAPARRNRASPKPRRSPRTGIGSFAQKLRAGEIKNEKTFGEVSEHYLREYDIITQGQRNKRYVDGQHWRCRGRLVRFFGNLGISEITAGQIQNYRRTAYGTRISACG